MRKSKLLVRILSVILAVVSIVTALPMNVFAENASGENGGIVTETYAEGKNSVGDMLAETIEEAETEAEELATATAGISRIDFEDSCAVVEFSTQTDAKLVVAVYTEDGKQMLTAEVKDVVADETNATVSFDDYTFPEYYLVKAFLLDAETNGALCSPFSNDTHTEAYIEFMSLNVNDFDADKVINLDESEDTNFLVVSNKALQITGTSSVNTLVSSDYETGTFVFDNIDSQMQSLIAGDIIYYTGEDDAFEVIKVKSVEYDGTAVTIIADEIEMEEAFECIKIDTSEIESETETVSRAARNLEMNQSVTFFKGDFEVSLKKNESGKIRPKITEKYIQIGTAKEDDSSEAEEDNGPIEDEENSLTYVAKLNLQATLSLDLKILINSSYKKVEWSIKGEAGVKVDIGAVFEEEFTLGSYIFPLFALVNVGMKVKLKIEASVHVYVEGTLTFRVGFKMDSEKSEKIYEAPSFKPEFKVEGEVFIGLVLDPYVYVINENLVNVKMPVTIGPKISASMSTDTTFDENHDCEECIAGNIKVQLKVDAKVEIAKKGWSWIHHDWSASVISCSYHVADFYYSITHNQFGWGLCSYIASGEDSNSSGGGLTGNEQVGDIVTFGSYPQTKVTNQNTLDALNSYSLSWKSYGYYTGTGSIGTMTQSDYMKYADVIHNGNKYRAVTFSQYRPHYTYYTSSAGYSYQDNNGYSRGTTYWFKYEPLKWKVLDPDTGYLLCESIIDSQAYSNTVYGSDPYYNNSSKTIYANDYATSSIREWLNNDFYNTAFTDAQKQAIKTTTLDNSACSSSYSEYDSKTTNDKIFLPSYKDVLNSNYGFSTSTSSSTTRTKQGTDYAKAQGLYVYSGNSYWRLRSAGDYSYYSCLVGYYGYVDSYDSVYGTDLGIAPALKLNHSSSISTSSISETENSESSLYVVDIPQGIDVQGSAVAVSKGYASCKPNTSYVILNVADYGDDFELKTENLYYIDGVTSNGLGQLNVDFIPTVNDTTSTTLLIGDFGNGVTETKILTESVEVDETYTVSGKSVSSALVELIPVDVDGTSYQITSVNGTYSIENVLSGTYTMRVTKENYVTREYEVTVTDSDFVHDIEINLIGDITGDGEIKTADIVKLNAHLRKTNPLSGYELNCADVTGEGNVTTTDIVKLNAHLRGTNKLW